MSLLLLLRSWGDTPPPPTPPQPGLPGAVTRPPWSQMMLIMRQKITAMALQFNGATIPVEIRKMPTKMDTIDPGTQILIVPDDMPPKIERYGMMMPSRPRGIGRYIYSTDVVLIAPNKMDWAKNLSLYTRWLELMMRTFSGPSGLVFGSQSIDGLQDVRAVPLSFLNRKQMLAGYDTFTIRVDAYVCRSLTGTTVLEG